MSRSSVKNIRKLQGIEFVERASKLVKDCENQVGRKADMIIATTCTYEPLVIPSLASRIANYLGKDVITDISSHGCLGIAHALLRAYNHVALSKKESNVIVVVGDYVTKTLNKKDFRSKAIFSDSLAVVMISNKSKNMNYKIYQPQINQWHEGAYSMTVDSIYEMQAGEVVKFVEEKVGPIIKKIKNSYIIPHSASKLTIDNMIAKNKLNSSNFYTGGLKTGNKTNAAVLFGLEENMDKERVTLVPFGAEFGVGQIKLKKL